MEMNNQNSRFKESCERWERNHKRGKKVGGVFIIIIGVLFLLRELGVMIPSWMFTWQMLLIGIGTMMLVKHSFRHFGGYLLIFIGTAFILRDYCSWYEHSNLIWPIAIILTGAYIFFKPRKPKGPWSSDHHHHHKYTDVNKGGNIDRIQVSSVFGGVEKSVTSKNFQGGQIDAIFGGAEINLSQADFTGVIEMEVNQIFGGTRLVIPPHWEVKSELTAILGSVEDKRRAPGENGTDPNKVLIIKGNAIFGGLEIHSF